MSKKKKIAVALSGGADSSFSALSLLRARHEVAGFTFAAAYTVKDSLEKAASLCRKLNIPHFIIDAGKQFEESVVKYFIASYAAGQTPNPCCVCNRDIKFGILKRAAREKGYAMATIPNIGLLPAKDKIGIMAVLRANVALVRTVIAGEKNQGIIGQMVFIQFLQHLADGPVDLCNKIAVKTGMTDTLKIFDGHPFAVYFQNHRTPRQQRAVFGFWVVCDHGFCQLVA